MKLAVPPVFSVFFAGFLLLSIAFSTPCRLLTDFRVLRRLSLRNTMLAKRAAAPATGASRPATRGRNLVCRVRAEEVKVGINGG